MNDLISRNLVMVSRKKFTGDVESCRIHDLLHEFCAIKANRKKFMSTIRGHDELFTFHGQRDLQRLCVHSTPEEFEKSKISCPNVRSLLFFATDDDDHELPHIPAFFHFFKLLKVLELRYIYLDSKFPSEIVMLVELRYLVIRGKFDYIPSAVADLSNLEFLLVWAKTVFLPDTIWNMSKLRVLWSRCSYLLDDMDIDNLERSPDLHNLDTFSTLELFSGESLQKIMRKLPNIHKLKCEFKESGKSIVDCNGLVVMDFLSRLESLHLRRVPQIEDMYHIGFRFPKNLKKLTLSRFHSSVIPKNGELTNLVVLKLQNIDFEGGIWNMNKEWEFPNLKFLELNCLGIDRWTGTDDVIHFPCLEKLALHSCWGLEEVPSCLRDNTTLQTIEVSHCPKSVVSLIMQIKEYQKNDWGNEDLQVLVTNTEE